MLYRQREQRGCKSGSLICSQVSSGRDAAVLGCIHSVAWMRYAKVWEIVMAASGAKETGPLITSWDSKVKE